MGGLGARSGPGFCRVIGAPHEPEFWPSRGVSSLPQASAVFSKARFAPIGLSCPTAESLLGPKSVRKREALGRLLSGRRREGAWGTHGGDRPDPRWGGAEVKLVAEHRRPGLHGPQRQQRPGEGPGPGLASVHHQGLRRLRGKHTPHKHTPETHTPPPTHVRM